MDPIAHTLAGATLAQTSLKKTTPLATATLVIAANLPDIDVVFQFVSQDASLYYRRGMTHGVLAMLFLPLLLSGGMMVFDKYVRRRRQPDAQPVDARGLLLLSYIGLLSHPALDWLNTYGVRLLMPFSGKWFYGDLLYIVDAWLWLLMAASVVFAYSRSWLGRGAWILLGAITSFAVMTHPTVPLLAKAVWWIGIIAIIALRYKGVSPKQNRSASLLCIACFCAYLGATGLGNNKAAQVATQQIPASFGDVTQLMSSPLPANPFARNVIAVTADHYHAYKIRLIGSPTSEQLYAPVAIETPSPVVQAALEMDAIKGFVNWMRFPVYTTVETDGGYHVTIRDLRYVRPDTPPGDGGIGIAEVFVPRGVVRGE